MAAGVDAARSRAALIAVIFLDADLQDLPEIILQFSAGGGQDSRW